MEDHFFLYSWFRCASRKQTANRNAFRGCYWCAEKNSF